MRVAATARPGVEQRRAVLLALLNVAVYLALSLWLYKQICRINFGHFVFGLDDPYIHLALSQGIAHGHYGINSGEFASPSSSLLWPYLLALFARFRWQHNVPLALNLAAGCLTAILAAAAVARWPEPPTTIQPAASEHWRRGLSSLALIFVANLLGLTFIGMEHTLQVLLAGAGAWGIIACLRHRPVPVWCLIAVAIGPSVRYEALGITLALAVALVGRRQAGRAGALLIASIAPLILFSLYLHHLGLPWLPTSVMVKSHVAKSTGLGDQGLALVGSSLAETLIDPQRVLLLLLTLTLAALAFQDRDRSRRFALAGAAVAAALHLLIGRFHWFNRYEVYIIFFSALVVLHVIHERPRALLGWYMLGLLACSFEYLDSIVKIPITASQIYRQQLQTARFVDDFYRGNVAVNDIGLVSYYRPAGSYVLDLWGLASVDAARQNPKTTAWLDRTVRAHHVGLVAIYPLWFPPLPADWTLLGELCLNEAPVVVGGSCVSYYATSEASLPELQDQFDRFTHTLPRGLTVRPAEALPFYTQARPGANPGASVPPLA